MEINSGITEFASWIAEILHFEVDETEDSFVYVSRMLNSSQLELKKEKLQYELNQLAGYEDISETIIATEKSYEILVREEGSYRGLLARGRVVEVEDSENGFKYKLGSPSNEFTLYLIQKAASYGNPRALFRHAMSSSMMQRAIAENPCILEFVKTFIAGRLTLKVTSNTKKTSNEFDKYSSAFLFNISYNTDTALVQQRDFDELLRTGRITQSRRFNIDEIEPPRRTYIPDLIHHYQLAVATENPMLEYISYYHIVEHFFESIFAEALVEKVRNKLTHPDFSYKRSKDISSLIKEIGNSIKMRDESMIFNEQEGLKLTLQKYINLSALSEKLKEYDSTLIEYYKRNTVGFSGACMVDIDSDNKDSVFKHLSTRIYKNRNSIVHSKESEKSKYTPFRDDKTLVKEVPLIRFISEQIIFATSSLA